MSEKFWNCFVEGTSGGYYYKHTSLEDAKNEAERLARMPNNKGRRVYIVESLCYCLVPETPIEWYGI